MKAKQLTPKEVNKIVYALELVFGDINNLDKNGLKLANKIEKAKAVIIAK